MATAKLQRSQLKIYQILSNASAPTKASALAKDVGVKSNTVRSMLSKMEKQGLITHDEDGFFITGKTVGDEGEYEVEKSADRGTDYESDEDDEDEVMSMEEAGLTAKSFFEKTAKRIGINSNHIPVISEYVFSQDPEDMAVVWHNLSKMNIPPDKRKMLWESYRVFMNKPVPDELANTVSKSKEEMAKEERDGVPEEVDRARSRGWMVSEDGPVWVGTSLGYYTLQEAKDIYAIKMMGMKNIAASHEKTSANNGGSPDTLSNLITALAPFLKQDTDSSTLKELISERLQSQEERFMRMMPQQKEEKPMSDRVQEWMGILSALAGAGPFFRSFLGIPDMSQLVQEKNNSSNTPIQLQNADGTPVVMDLNNFFAINKFQSEMRREEESHKARQELVGASKDFIAKIGNAAARLGGG